MLKSYDKGVCVLVNHPYFGSVWLHDCYQENGFIVGEACEKMTPTGDGHLDSTMNFPTSCIRIVTSKREPD